MMITKLLKRLVPAKLKQWIKARIRNIAGTEEANYQITRNEDRISSLESLIFKTHGQTNYEPKLKINSINYISTPWWETNFWEPAVQICLRDLIKPGNIALDVGANLGGLSVLMARLTGPEGKVYAFEASPRIIELLHGNIIASGCTNIHLFHNAVFSETGKDIDIFAGGHLNDSILNQGEFIAKVGAPVKTLALDDFVNHMGITPNVIKMDIEGAEYFALCGLQNTIRQSNPHLILETNPNDLKCFDFLKERGYFALDLSNYRWINCPSDFTGKSEIRNLFYCHNTKMHEVPYSLNSGLSKEFEFAGNDFQFQNDSWISQWFSMKPGRYVLEWDLEGCSEDEVQVGIANKSGEISRYHANRGFLALHYCEMPFHVVNFGEFRFFVRVLKNMSPSQLPPRAATVSRVEGFSTLQKPYFNFLVA